MNIQDSFAMFIGALFGATSIVFGAFGAHLLKKYMSKELLDSFEVGVRYQMYHAILLLFIGLLPTDNILSLAVNLIIGGVVLFSFSIYGLSLSSTFGKKWSFLGPITPLGGLLLVSGWICLAIYFLGI